MEMHVKQLKCFIGTGQLFFCRLSSTEHHVWTNRLDKEWESAIRSYVLVYTIFVRLYYHSRFFSLNQPILNIDGKLSCLMRQRKTLSSSLTSTSEF